MGCPSNNKAWHRSGSLKGKDLNFSAKLDRLDSSQWEKLWNMMRTNRGTGCVMSRRIFSDLGNYLNFPKVEVEDNLEPFFCAVLLLPVCSTEQGFKNIQRLCFNQRQQLKGAHVSEESF